MRPTTWLGVPVADWARAVERVASPQHDPIDVAAAAVGSVLIEPGDATWGDCVAQSDAATVVAALVTSQSLSEFAAALHLPVDDQLAAARERWLPRLSHRSALDALEHAANVGARVVLPSDAEWPTGLFDLGPHMPGLLYVRGQRAVEWEAGVALVGARAASGYGEMVAADLAGALAADGVLIISGAAYGIDGVAHRAALAALQPTVAFLAGGIDRLYPGGHVELLSRIAATGLVISETPCGRVPSKFRFLQRNRLIAAASQGTIVVEAGRRSGSLNTAHHAATIGRPLGVIPGPVSSPSSAGCHFLLREGPAVCVTNAREVKELIWGSAPDEQPRRADPALQRLRDALTERPATLAEIAVAAGFSLFDTSGLLAEAEVHGWAECVAGHWKLAARS